MLPICLPYVLLIAFLSGCSIIYNNQESETIKKQITLVAIAVFFVFFAFRGFILSDWIIYYSYFYNCSFYDITEYTLGSSTHWEPGFTMLNLICKSIFKDYFFFQFVVCAIDTCLLLYFFRKYVKNISLALILYLTFEGLVISTNLMRNSIAICIYINAIPYLYKRKSLPYFLICTLSLSFHISSLIYFPLYFFFHRKLNKWGFLVIFLACNIVFLSRISIFLTIASALGIDQQFAIRVKAYTESYNASTGISIGYIERLLTGTLVFLYYNKLHAIRKENAIFINSLTAYLFMFFFLSEFSVLSKRFATLFAFGYWIIWIDLIQCFYYQNNKRLFKCFVYIYCMLRMAGSTYLPDFQYDNLLFGIKTYQERLYIHNKTFEIPQ